MTFKIAVALLFTAVSAAQTCMQSTCVQEGETCGYDPTANTMVMCASGDCVNNGTVYKCSEDDGAEIEGASVVEFTIEAGEYCNRDATKACKEVRSTHKHTNTRTHEHTNTHTQKLKCTHTEIDMHAQMGFRRRFYLHVR